MKINFFSHFTLSKLLPALLLLRLIIPLELAGIDGDEKFNIPPAFRKCRNIIRSTKKLAGE